MTNNSAKHKALKTLLQNKLYSLTDYNALQRIIESKQFTIIEYKKHTNSEYISELITKLGVEDEIEHNDSFLYLKNNLRFLFINSSIPEEDRCSLLRHELGHIYDPDFKNSAVNYSKIKKEEFANEFSLYIRNPGIGFKLFIFIIKKWKLLVSMLTLIACVSGFLFMISSLFMQATQSVANNISTFDNSNKTCYVTSGGKKYHRKFCIIVKYRANLTEYTINEAVDAGYKPCLICIPED